MNERTKKIITAIVVIVIFAGDMHRLAKMLPDALQQHHQLVVQPDGIAALAGKLPHLEAG